MKAKDVLRQLEREWQEQGFKLVYDDLRSEGGVCRLRDRFFLVINRLTSVETRIRLLRDALAQVRDAAEEPQAAPPVEADAGLPGDHVAVVASRTGSADSN